MIEFTKGYDKLAIGVLLRAPYAEMIHRLLEDFKYPIHLRMPCGHELRYDTPRDIPRVTTPCPCGDERHEPVKIVIDPALDTREDKSIPWQDLPFDLGAYPEKGE